MSSTVDDTVCKRCNSNDAIYETFKDSETGHIIDCKKCGYIIVYRQSTETKKVIEDYQGYDHPYKSMGW